MMTGAEIELDIALRSNAAGGISLCRTLTRYRSRDASVILCKAGASQSRWGRRLCPINIVVARKPLLIEETSVVGVIRTSYKVDKTY